MMNNPLKQLPQWISNHQKRKIQRIAHKLWEEDGKKKEPTYCLGAQSHYYQLKTSQQLHSAQRNLLNPLQLAYATKKQLQNILAFFKTLAILKILGILGNITIFIALITLLATEQQRRDAEIYQAWQVITAAHDQSGSGGRKEALEFLNSSPRRFPLFWLKWTPQSLAGLAAPKAHLVQVQLPGANLSRANLQETDLSKANLQEALLPEANLQKAELSDAYLQKAFLYLTNLQKAHLYFTNLQKAELSGAHLQEADLSGAHLQEANLSGAYLQKANLSGAHLQDTHYTNQNTPQNVCQSLPTFLKHPCPTIFPDNFNPESHHMTLITNLNQLKQILTKYPH